MGLGFKLKFGKFDFLDALQSDNAPAKQPTASSVSSASGRNLIAQTTTEIPPAPQYQSQVYVKPASVSKNTSNVIYDSAQTPTTYQPPREVAKPIDLAYQQQQQQQQQALLEQQQALLEQREREHKEQLEKERREREQREKELREQLEREVREREQREYEQRERERVEREKEQREREQREKEQREREFRLVGRSSFC